MLLRFAQTWFCGMFEDCCNGRFRVGSLLLVLDSSFPESFSYSSGESLLCPVLGVGAASLGVMRCGVALLPSDLQILWRLERPWYLHSTFITRIALGGDCESYHKSQIWKGPVSSAATSQARRSRAFPTITVTWHQTVMKKVGAVGRNVWVLGRSEKWEVHHVKIWMPRQTQHQQGNNFQQFPQQSANFQQFPQPLLCNWRTEGWSPKQRFRGACTSRFFVALLLTWKCRFQGIFRAWDNNPRTATTTCSKAPMSQLYPFVSKRLLCSWFGFSWFVKRKSEFIWEPAFWWVQCFASFHISPLDIGRFSAGSDAATADAALSSAWGSTDGYFAQHFLRTGTFRACRATIQCSKVTWLT